MEENAFLDPFVRMLAGVSSPQQVRAVEAGASMDSIWRAAIESGYLDALVPEIAGGFGLTLGDMGPLIEALGSFLTPAPIAETMAARAIIARHGETAPSGPILLATAYNGLVRGAGLALVADYMLLDSGSRLELVALKPDLLTSGSVAGKLSADIARSTGILSLPRPADGLLPLQAVLRATQTAGAASSLLAMTTAYANDRVQFGKPIGRQQAVQQQLAVLAEKTVLTRLAASMGYNCDLFPHVQAAAVAKSITSAAAVHIAAIAHAIHGAIGISEEHDLQLYTRHIHQWRSADGSESWWARQIGAAWIASNQRSLDFLRAI